MEQRNGWGTRGNLWGHWTGLFDGHEREGGRKELKHRGRVGEGVGGDMRNITPDVCDCDHCEDVGEELKCRFVHLLLLCVCVCTLCDNCSFRFRPDGNCDVFHLQEFTSTDYLSLGTLRGQWW